MVVGYKLYSSPMDCEPGGSVCASRDMRLGAKVSWSKSTEIIESALLSLSKYTYILIFYHRIRKADTGLKIADLLNMFCCVSR